MAFAPRFAGSSSGSTPTMTIEHDANADGIADVDTRRNAVSEVEQQSLQSSLQNLEVLLEVFS